MSNELKKYFPKSIIKRLKGSSCLVTGGSGMIGREVVRFLNLAGAKVTSVSLDKIKKRGGVKFIYGDLTDFNFCKKICKKKDFLFHIAGIKGSIFVTKEKPASFFVPLLMMNTNILEAARLNKIKNVVYTSSIGAYHSANVFKERNIKYDSSPMDEFPGWAKRMAELQILAYKKQFNSQKLSVVRPSNVYGPGDNFDSNNAMVIPSLISKIFKQKKNQKKIKIWGDGSAKRDFIFSTDCAVGIINACFYGYNCGPINLGSGIATKISTLITELKKIKNFRYQYDNTKSSGYPVRVMDMEFAKRKIKYKNHHSLKKGLYITYNWFVKNHEEFKKKKNYFNEKI
jgi:GDP-L-fucose synthase